VKALTGQKRNSRTNEGSQKEENLHEITFWNIRMKISSFYINSKPLNIWEIQSLEISNIFQRKCRICLQHQIEKISHYPSGEELPVFHPWNSSALLIPIAWVYRLHCEDESCNWDQALILARHGVICSL
jgi:hypothetical protein